MVKGRCCGWGLCLGILGLVVVAMAYNDDRDAVTSAVVGVVIRLAILFIPSLLFGGVVLSAIQGL